MAEKYLTLDIGASSGRAFVITKDKQDIGIKEVYRFLNIVYQKDGKLYWDFKHLMHEIHHAIRLAFSMEPLIKSIGIDTWGVDYGYIDQMGQLLRDPVCYRDPRGLKASEQFHLTYAPELLYRKTGIQYLPFNTVYQLYDDLINDEELTTQAVNILLIPDLIAYHLTGSLYTELTNASTTGLLDARKKTWINTFELMDKHIMKFPEFIKLGETYGVIKNIPEIPQVPVVSVCSHDTASAFASVRTKINQALISSGTWSLVGTVIERPNLSDDSFKKNFTNELGIYHHTRYLKNVMGLWIINQIKETLAQVNEHHSFFDLEKKAITSEPFKYFIDPDHVMFLEPGDMIERVKTYTEKTGQGKPKYLSEVLRAVYESLAFKYRFIIEDMEKMLETRMDEIIIIGGGNQSRLLNQFTANVSNRKVIIGPTEASVYGNGLVQMFYNKDIKSIKTGQNIIMESLNQKPIEPMFCKSYDTVYHQFIEIIDKGRNI